MNTEIYYHDHKNLPLVPIQSLINPTHALPSDFFNI